MELMLTWKILCASTSSSSNKLLLDLSQQLHADVRGLDKMLHLPVERIAIALTSFVEEQEGGTDHGCRFAVEIESIFEASAGVCRQRCRGQSNSLGGSSSLLLGDSSFVHPLEDVSE